MASNLDGDDDIEVIDESLDDLERFEDDLGDNLDEDRYDDDALVDKPSRRSSKRAPKKLKLNSETTSAGQTSSQPPARTLDHPQTDAKRQLALKIDRVCEFALVLMHCVLYKINYYDRKSHFDKSIKYDIIVYKCKSEIVCEYISNCVECMRLLLYEKYSLEEAGEVAAQKQNEDTFSIGLAVLKSLDSDQDLANLLIKRYTLQIECLLGDKTTKTEESSNIDEWNFRDALLKCLYSKDVQYPNNFKWQIQIRTSKPSIQKMNAKEDLFKLFAWRQCEREEVTSIKTKSSSYNRISIKPLKTMTHFNKLRV